VQADQDFSLVNPAIGAAIRAREFDPLKGKLLHEFTAFYRHGVFIVGPNFRIRKLFRSSPDLAKGRYKAFRHSI